MGGPGPASVYDPIPDIGLLYDSVPLYAARPDVAFFVEEAAAAGGPVLELGCGTGRILLPLARAGCTITGVDSSRAMMERCRLKLSAEPAAVRARVTLHEGDAGSAAPGGPFALITAPFRVLQHLTTIERQLQLLDSVARHLAPGGLFIFDVFNPDFTRMATDRSGESEDTPELRLPDGRLFRRTARIPRVRWLDQILEVELIYYVSDERTGQSGRFVQAFEMRWHLREELSHLVARAGFRPVAVYGDYARLPLTDASPEQVWCLRRA
jgi:SAM-dependent methyltransferase